MSASLSKRPGKYIRSYDRFYGIMRSQVNRAQSGIITPQMRAVAAAEGITAASLRDRIADGSSVIMNRGKRAIGIGRGLSTKINVNIGTSTGRISVDDEIRKARIAEEFGADTISDLSMGGDIPEIRKAIMAATTLPVTTVPIYETAATKGLGEMTADDIIATIRAQA